MKTKRKSEIDNILWATDLSNESKFCLPYIQYFSKIFKTKNQALYVLPKFSDWVYEAAFFSNEDLIKEIEKTKKKSFNKIQNLSEKHNINFEIKILEGVASEEIIKFSNKKKIDIIFAGRRGISELEQLLIGSTTSRLIRNSKLPIFVVPKRRRFSGIKKILSPIDFSSLWFSELKYSIPLAQKLKAKLYIAHVSEFFNYKVPFLKRDKLIKSINEKITKVAKENQYKIENIIYETGEAAHKIIEISKKNKIDLIVMTTHQRKGFEKFFLGSVTEKVLMASDIPMLILPSSYQ
jgi:nucleotide-binding universal stress UspA family protein